jgi:LuxR family transcriptional regulator, maltose regulon positive regulatory protein
VGYLRAAVAVPSAKVSVPRLIQRAVDRRRLLDGLLPAEAQEEPSAEVFLACAPAGYGKTTLLAGLADRLRSAGVPVAWVTCDREDDSTTFWAAVLLATTRAAGEPGTALASLVPPRGATDPAFVPSLLTVIEEELPDLLLVLDDVHELQDRGVLEALRQLLERAPPGLRIALGGRFEPSIGLHRLRLTGRLHEVRAADLAFTSDEAHEFWDRHGASLDEQLEDRLLDLTEGWPAGLRMAALSLERVDDPGQFVEDFAGDDRSVADYLAGEVIARLPDDMVEFLVTTCVVEEISGELAARLSGRPDSAALLDDLAQRNALVVRLGSNGRWFRYHALLRSYLSAVLERRDRGEAERLHTAAAAWYLERDRAAEALEHALSAKDDDLVATILRNRGLALLLAGTDAAVRHALESPSRALAGTPVILVHRALTALEDGDLAAAEETLAELERRPDEGTDERLTALRRVALLHKARMESDLAGASASQLVSGLGAGVEPRPQPDERLTDMDPDIRLLVLADRGVLRLVSGDLEGARQDLGRAAELARASRLDYLALYCLNHVTGAYVAQNDFPAGRRAAEAAIAFATERGWARSARMAYGYALAGWTAFLLLEPDAATRWAKEAVAVIDTSIDVEAEGVARSAEAVISFDDPPQRRAACERLEEITAWMTERLGSPALTATAAVHELRMCLGLGEWARAERAVVRAKQRLGPQGDIAVLEAQYAFARGRAVDAQRLLRPVLRGELTPTISTALTAAWLVEAMIAQRAGRPAAAAEALREALANAAPTGACRPFFDAGPQLRPLMMDMRGRAGHLEPFLETVLERIAEMDAWQAARAEGHSTRADAAAPRVDGVWLTERELGVLRDLPSMMTLSEIASAQGVSLNTVKTHVRSIYTKLNTGSRREAIAVARRRGLL